MYSRHTPVLLIVVCLFVSHEAMADHPVGANTYLGRWADTRNPSETVCVIDNVDGQIVIKRLVGNDVVSNIKHNAYSLSFLQTSPEVNPLPETSLSMTVNLIPDVRSNSNLFYVRYVEVESEGIHLIDSMTLVKNGNDQVKRKTGIPNEHSKRALESIYTKQWDLRAVNSTNDKMFVQVKAVNNNYQAVFNHRDNTTQVPAKIVDNTVIISFDTNEYNDMKNIPLFNTGGKYQLQLIPLCGNEDQIIVKACSIKGDRRSCPYFMAFSK